MTDYVIYSGSEEWSALYVDGKLEKYGDHYLVEEHLRLLLGVTTISSDNFLRGGNWGEDVAPTLDAIADWLDESLATVNQEARYEVTSHTATTWRRFGDEYKGGRITGQVMEEDGAVRPMTPVERLYLDTLEENL